MSRNLTRFGDALEVPLKNGIYKPKQFHGRGAKIVNMGELFAHPRMRDVPMRRLEMSEKELAKASLQSGDLIFARRSLTAEGAGKCSIVLEVNEPTTFESSIIRARLQQNSHSPLFFYYFFNSPQGKAALGSILRQVAVAGITGKDLQELMVPVVSTADQNRIAEMLGALDDKVELNRRMSETLEEMARALFRDWFVTFGPTRRQMEGATDACAIMGHAFPPEKAATLAPLFPAKLGDDGLPEGWAIGAVSDLADLNSASWTAKKHPDTVEYVDLSNTKWGRIEGTTRFTWSDAPSRARRVLEAGDTIVGTVRPGNGSYSLIGKAGLTGSTGFAVLKPKTSNATEFVYCALTSPDNIEKLANLADGGAYPAINPKVVAATKVALAGAAVINGFSEMTQSMFAKRHANEEENQTLAALRDLLLPKLMSGEIRLKDVEAAL